MQNSDTAFRKRRLVIFARDQWTCVQCGWCDETQTGRGLHADHIVSRYEAGLAGWSQEEINAEDNLQTLCSTHNLRKGAKTAGEWVTYVNPRWLINL